MASSKQEPKRLMAFLNKIGVPFKRNHNYKGAKSVEVKRIPYFNDGFTNTNNNLYSQ